MSPVLSFFARGVLPLGLLVLPMAAAWAQSGSPAAAVVPRPTPPAVTTAPGTLIETQPPPATGARLPARPVAPAVVETGLKRVMAVGEVQTIGLRGVARIAIGNGALVKATVVDDREIVLLAEGAGETVMHVWLRNGRQLSYELQVMVSRTSRVLDDLQAMLKETPGINVRAVGERIVIEGRYPNAEAAARIKLLGTHFPQVLNLVPNAPADADPLQLERMVQIDLRVVEVKKRALDQLGIKWATSANGPTLATNVLGYSNTPFRPEAGFAPVTTGHPIATYLGLATTITSALNFLEQNGDAWTLAEPRLSCRSGGSSEFLAGGEIPIPVGQGFGVVSVEYKKYGVSIEFKPVADGSGNIDSHLLIEVSQPDTRNSNGGFVAFTTNRTETQVALKTGEPLVISGLLRQSSDKSSDALPGLGRLPFISMLFGAKEARTEQTELFVIATPRVITPDSAMNKTAIDRAAALATDADQNTRGRLEPPPDEPAPSTTTTPMGGGSRGNR
ncbi:pilus assembly protein N-terminal domain-containing protein [Ideonella azotifigens]|uniref:Pilus assembly protein N-terminal domain-containing protein n=1 Tax=Ideonella azotifigens TaxID=513160 RepID=A0ABN1JNZ8_9BURK